MALFALHKTTASVTELVLACDPDVEAANSPEALKLYRESGDQSCIKIPDSATRFEVRALSLDERLAVDDAADSVRIEMHDSRPEGDAARAALIRLERRRALAVCRVGLVRARQGGETIEGGNAVLSALPDRLLYPAVVELAAAIRRLSTLAPLGK